MSINQRILVYDGLYGRFSGFLQKDGYWFIKEFVVHKHFRGKHLAKILAKKLPEKCVLIPSPLGEEGQGLNREQLIGFYESIGFKQDGSSYYWKRG
jgi:GNAT superfamily N-acetyltransferase